MTKRDLENLSQLTGEIQDIEKQLNKLEEKGTTEYVGDTVRDYRSGQGIPITIRGYPEHTYKRQRSLSRRYEAKKAKLIRQKMKLENELDNIQDIEIRRIIRLRYFERLSWDDVSIALNNTTTGDAARKQLDRYLKNS